MPAFFMKQYLKVIIPCTDISLREILIALLPDLGLDGMNTLLIVLNYLVIISPVIFRI